MRRMLVGSALAVCLVSFTAHALIGIGIHYGMDWSIDGSRASLEELNFGGIHLDSGAIHGTLPADMPAEIPGGMLPIYVARTGWERTPIDFGGKILIDAFRHFAIEISTNFGLWEYDGQIIYPTSISCNPGATWQGAKKPSDLFTTTYDTLHVTAKDLGMTYWGLDQTPYAKLNLDLTLRKNIFALPKRLKTISLYAGLGVSVNFATPVLSAQLIEDALGSKLQKQFTSVDSLGAYLLGNPDAMDAVYKKITDGLTVPKFGANIELGTQLKIPVIPLAFYVDGKLLLPFGQMDPYVKVYGYGFLVNAGVMLKF